MCKYRYKLSKNRGKTCSLRENFDYDLPLDSNGICIFHSEDIHWKRKENFFKYLLDFLSLEKDKKYNLSEFRLIGNELRKKKDSDYYIFHLPKKNYAKMFEFDGAVFLDACEFNDIHFDGGADFKEAIFKKDVLIYNSRFNGIDFTNAKFQNKVIFSNIQFDSYSFFQKVDFKGDNYKYFELINSNFSGMTDFSGSTFLSKKENSMIEFKNINFEDGVTFDNVEFYDRVLFENVSFYYDTTFVDTLFATIKSSIRYMEVLVNFKNIEIQEKAKLIFRSTNPQKLLFEEEIDISFKEELLGHIEFENANFTKFTDSSREELFKLEKLKKVTIGSGCIKYRHQTKIKTISIKEDNIPLAEELFKTFTNYFVANNGFNLGFEIIERNKYEIRFFYFTDENISKNEFLDKLAKNEKELWGLIFPKLGNKNLLEYNKDEKNLYKEKDESKIINMVDGISALMGTFFRVSVRIGLGRWNQEDTKNLMEVTAINDSSPINYKIVHRTIINNYSQKVLFGWHNNQTIENN